MGLLKEAVNESAFLKCGIFGLNGSGKTRTATEIAIGMAKMLKEKGDTRPVGMYDTEKGSDFLIPIFQKAGIKFLRVKTRSFQDLITFTKEAEATCSIALIDSITHVWGELQESFRRKKKISRMEFHHWGPLKEEWAQFTDLFVNSKLHVVLCGRAGYEYETGVNEETGKKEVNRAGSKMKAEGEMGYEPDLLIEMERVRKADATGKKKDKGLVNRAHILKDRTDTMNGMSVDFPTFKSFAPIIGFLNIGGTHQGFDASRTSDAMFDSPDWSRLESRKQREICGEVIKESCVLAKIDGQGKEEKETRTKSLIEAFGTSAWTAIMDLPLHTLDAGVRKFRVVLGLAKEPEKKPADDLPAWAGSEDEKPAETAPASEATKEAA